MCQIGEPLLGFLAFGDVANMSNEHRYSPRHDWRYREFDRKFCAISAHCRKLKPLAENRAFANREIMRKPPTRCSTNPRQNDQLVQRLTEHCLARASEHYFGCRIELQDFSFVIDGQYAIEC